MKKPLLLEDLTCYKMSFMLSNYIWDIVVHWDYFAKDTVGKQWIRAIDSISANIAEGFGRYTKKDKISFYRYSYGSLKEAQDWTRKAWQRKLLTNEQHVYIAEVLNKLPKEINGFIKFTNISLTK